MNTIGRAPLHNVVVTFSIEKNMGGLLSVLYGVVVYAFYSAFFYTFCSFGTSSCEYVDWGVGAIAEALVVTALLSAVPPCSTACGAQGFSAGGALCAAVEAAHYVRASWRSRARVAWRADSGNRMGRARPAGVQALSRPCSGSASRCCSSPPS